MFTKSSLRVCLQALLIQGLSAQCIGAYNTIAAAAGWPAANSLAWESGISWPTANALAWESTAPLGAPSPFATYAPLVTTELISGYSPARLAASNGGGLAVTSASPISANGVSMTSENIYEGPLAVSGDIPFLGTVAIEGALPTSGAGAVAYGCGNGNVAMVNEDYAAGYGVGALGYGAGLAGPVYGYNGLASPVAIEAGIAGPAYGAAGALFGGCGYGAVY